MSKKSKQKRKDLEYEKSFQDGMKSISHHCKRLLVAKSFLRPDSAPIRLQAFRRSTIPQNNLSSSSSSFTSLLWKSENFSENGKEPIVVSVHKKNFKIRLHFQIRKINRLFEFFK